MVNGTILILGNPGAGKSFMAKQISDKLQLPIVELDNLFWGPNWTKLDYIEVYKKVTQEIQNSKCIIEGQYPEMKDLLPRHADTIIFIDLPLKLLFWRLFRRSIRRVVFKEFLCNGNKETLSKMFFSKHSMIYYVFQVFEQNRRDNYEIIRHAKKNKKTTYVFNNTAKIINFIDSLNFRKGNA